MVDLLVAIAPHVVVGVYSFPAFQIFRELAKVVLKPIEPPPSKTIPQLAQTTPSIPSIATLDDDGAWFPNPFLGTVRIPAFTPEPTPFVPHSMLPQAAAPVKNLEHLPNVLSSDPARAMMVFIFIVTSYLFIQFFARHIRLRHRFSPVTHVVSTVITVYLCILTGSASHYSLLSMPVTLEQAKESALPVACATLAAFSIFNMLISVVESLLRNVLAGIEVSPTPKLMKPHIKCWVIIIAIAPVFFYLIFSFKNYLPSFEVTVRREIESNLASVDPRFVAFVIMAIVALCVVDMLLGFLQWCNIPLLGLSCSTFTCGPVVLVVRIFQALAYVIFRSRPFRWSTDSLILATAYTFRTWANYLKVEVEVEPENLYDSDNSITDVSSTCGVHQHETGLTDAARPTDTSVLIKYLDAKLSTQNADLGAGDSEIAQLKRHIEFAERANSRMQTELTSALKMVESQQAEIDKLQSRIAFADTQADHALNEGLKGRLKKMETRSTTEGGAQTLPVVFTDATAATIVPAPVVEKAEFGVHVDPVAPAARVLVERSVQVKELRRHLINVSTQSVQHNPVLIDSATQTTPRILVDSSVQAQEPSRQVTEVAVQVVEAIRVFADSTTQTDVPPPTVPAAEHQKALTEVDELRIRLHDVESKLEEIAVAQSQEPTRVFADSTAQTDVPLPTVPASEYAKALTEIDELHIRLRDIESKREEVDIAQAKEEDHNEQEAYNTSFQLPNGGPKVSIQVLAAFLGAKLNQAFAPQMVNSMPEDGEEEDDEEEDDEEEDEILDAEESPHQPPTNESSDADTTAPIPNVSPDMYSTYEAIAGKKFTIPADPDVSKLDQMPVRQWIMSALQSLYVARLSKYSEDIKTSEQVQGSNIAATQALGQGNHALMIAMRQLAHAHTLSKMSPEEVNGSPVPAYVTVDWKSKKPMDDDRIGRSFYKLQRHVLDAIRDKVTPNPFVVSALNLMEFSIAFAERLYSDIKEPEWFKNSSDPDIRRVRLWIKEEAGVWVMDEDLLALAELTQGDWKWRTSFKNKLNHNDERDTGYPLLTIKRGIDLKTSVAEEAGEQPPAEVEEKKLKKRSDGVWGHEMSHYTDQVYDEPSVDESIDQEEEAEVEAKVEVGVPSDHQSAPVRLQPEVVVPPVETQTVQPLEEPEPVPVPPVELEGTTTCNKEKGKGKDPALVKQNSLTEAEKELGPINFERTANFSWDDELARQPTTTPHPQQGHASREHPSLSFHGHGNNEGIPLQIETERNPNIPRQPASSSVSPTTDTQISFASGLMASRHAPKLTGSMASMHAPRPTGLYASMHAPSPPTPQTTGTMASMHAPKLTGSMASMHAPRPSTSPVVDRNRSMHADDPSPPVSPSPSQHNRNRDRNRRGGRSGTRLGSHQLN